MRKFLKVCVALIVVFACSVETRASFIQEEQARRVAENWRAKNPNPMNSSMGYVIDEIRLFQGEPYGNPGYYVAFFNPSGWVVIPADTAFEPILAFGTSRLTPELFEKSPIRNLFRVDVPIRPL